MSEKAARVVSIPDPVVGRDRDAAGTGAIVGQRVCLELTALGFDRPDLIRAEKVEPGLIVRVDPDAVRARSFRHAPEPDLAVGLRELAYDAGTLRGEPRVALPIERHRVRIAHRRVRHHEVRELARRGVQLDDAPILVAGEPYHPSAIDHQVVRVGAGIDVVPLELAALRVEVGYVVAHLSDEPDAPLPVYVWITRPGSIPRRAPHFRLRARSTGLAGRLRTGEGWENERQRERDLQGTHTASGQERRRP